jgi:hypothetical protein
MMFLEEIKNLEEQGVFISFFYDHYKSGSNCNFSISIVEDGKVKYGTGWHGDNHEYGDTHENMRAALNMAAWLIADKERMHNYFTWAKETVTKEGLESYKLHQDTRQALRDYMYKTHEPYRKSCDEGTKFMEEYENEN